MDVGSYILVIKIILVLVLVSFQSNNFILFSYFQIILLSYYSVMVVTN